VGARVKGRDWRGVQATKSLREGYMQRIELLGGLSDLKVHHREVGCDRWKEF